MFEGVDEKVVSFALDLAENYAKVKKFGNKSMWSNEQIDQYLAKIELGLSSTAASVSDDDDVIDRADKLLGGVVEVIENNQQPRTDLTCPFCKGMVYDNRHDKKSDRSPDFVCSGRSPDECSAHTGKWRKSWWLNSSDLPKEWGFGT